MQSYEDTLLFTYNFVGKHARRIARALAKFIHLAYDFVSKHTRILFARMSSYDFVGKHARGIARARGSKMFSMRTHFSRRVAEGLGVGVIDLIT